MSKVYVIYDSSNSPVRRVLESLLHDLPGQLHVPGISGGRQGRLWEDAVRQPLLEARAVLAFVDEPSIDVGLEIGFALGLGKPVGLACRAPRLPGWLQRPPLKGFMAAKGLSVDDIKALVTGDDWIEAPPPLVRGDHPFLLAPRDDTDGQVIHRLRNGQRPHWRTTPSHEGWNLDDVPRVLDGLGRLIWAVTPPTDTDEGDGSENACNAILVGMHLAASGGSRNTLLSLYTAPRPASDVLAAWGQQYGGQEDFLRMADRFLAGSNHELGSPAPTAPAMPAARTAPRPPERRPAELETMIQELERRRATSEYDVDGEYDTDLERRIREKKAALRQPQALQVGDVLGDDRYVLEEVLGSGGFAQVWKAWDRHREQFVALKVLHGQHVSEPSRVRRFFSGARKQSRLVHPHIVRVQEPEQRDEAGRLFFSMDFISGRDLRTAVAAGDLRREQVLDALKGIAAALDHAWTRFKIVHRDVKPANILLDQEGHAYLSDFDLVHAPESTQQTLEGQGMGTYDFAAPEVLRGDGEASHKSDVYSLARTVQWALSGEAASSRGDARSRAALRATGLPRRGQAALLRSLDEQPSRRHARATNLLDEIVRATAAAGHGAAGSRTRRERVWPVVILAGLLMLSVVLVLDPGGLIGGGPVAGAVVGQVAFATSPDAAAWTLGEPPPSIEGLAYAGENEKGYPEYEQLLPDDVPLRLVLLPADSFLMGSPEGEEERWDDERPQHNVTLDAFLIAKTECTQRQWQAVMGANPSRFTGAGLDAPVEQVSWEDIQTFEDRTGLALPSEAQWEYAARAGTTTALYTGTLTIRGRLNGPELDPIAWYGGNSGVEYDGASDSSDWEEKQYPHTVAGTHPVGLKQANGFGLHDVLGNVGEWCEDTWHSSYEGAPDDESAWVDAGSGYRVLRGGGWSIAARFCRSALRDWGEPGFRGSGVGFRPARSLP